MKSKVNKSLVVDKESRDVKFPLTFIVKGVIPSQNHLYGHSKFGVYMRPEGKLYKINVARVVCEKLGFESVVDEKKKLITVLQSVKTLPTDKFELDYKIYGRWLTKSGETLTSDCNNRLKILDDSIADALSIDDKFFWKTTVEKIHEELEENYRVEINLTPYIKT